MGLDKDFLSMLEARVDWRPFTGEDLFGNDAYGAPVTVAAYVGDLGESLGAQDGQNKQDTQRVGEADLFTDAVGIRAKDQITLPSGEVFYARAVNTGRDEKGSPLYHEVSLSTSPRG